MRTRKKRRKRVRHIWQRAAALAVTIPCVALPAGVIAYAGNFFLIYIGLYDGERRFVYFFLMSSLTVMVWASLCIICDSAGRTSEKRGIYRTWPLLITMLILSALLVASFDLHIACLETVSILLWLGIMNAVPIAEEQEH